jgi:cell division protein FtsX
MWTTLASFFAVCIAIVSVLYSVRCLHAVRAAAAAWESSPARKCSCVSQIESLRNSLNEQADALQTIANRVKMQRVRTAALHVGDQSTTSSDPAEIKAALRRRAGLIAGQPAPHS